MSKPDDIPQDVWDDAVSRAAFFGGHTEEQQFLAEGIAVAVMLEREKCARVADAQEDHMRQQMGRAKDVREKEYLLAKVAASAAIKDAIRGRSNA